MSHILSATLRKVLHIALLCALPTQLTQAAQLLHNGNFERGDLSAWQDLSSGMASSQIVQQGNCFAGLDTREINIRGKFSAMLRSDGKPDSSATIRSDTFIAGEGFAFIALRGMAIQAATNFSSDDNALVDFQVDILDAQNNRTLISLALKPRLLELESDCPSAARVGQFSSHYISTHAYAGQPIKIQFTQRSTDNSSAFSLIDQVVRFSDEEQLLFYARPHAQAGVSVSRAGTRYLDSTGSFSPAAPAAPLSYAWALNDRRYRGARPCLNDLQAGNYQVILYVNDSQHAISDAARIYIGAAENPPGNKLDPQCDTPPAPVKQTVKQAPEKPAKAENTPSQSSAEPALRQALQNWLQAWSVRDANAYIAAYIKNYAPTGKSHASWVADRRWNFKTRQYIKVDISDIKITEQDGEMRANFDQSYESNTYQGEVKRVLIFVKQNNHWKIHRESNAE